MPLSQIGRVDVLNIWQPDQYQLIDFGQGRKLERFGERILDRPCPAAMYARMNLSAHWQQAHLRLSEHDAHSSPTERPARSVEAWQVRFDRAQFELRVTPFGHVGLFPEHAAQWQWLLQQSSQLQAESPSLLNLFAYTGGASLVLASHGWQVTHVDASEPTVQWARQNAQRSGLSDAPIRWLVEDARVYVAREMKRGRRYDAILLDPPSYGHGPSGKAWQIERDLMSLLEQCCQLLTPHGCLVLTGHSDPAPLTAADIVDMRRAFGQTDVTADFSRVTVNDMGHRPLDFGWCLRTKAQP